jgi:pimeloyl-ACP methyl ester carboxylesterase
VVAHSTGATKALQLALDHPGAVQSLTLIEPALPTPEFGEFLGRVVPKASEAYARGDHDGAVAMNMAAVFGSDDFRVHLDQVLPADWWERCVADYGYLLAVEAPSLAEWSFGPDEGKRITHPVLLIEGAETLPMCQANNQHFKQWVPQAELKIIPGVNHFIQFLKPAETANAIEPFLKRHSSAYEAATMET